MDTAPDLVLPPDLDRSQKKNSAAPTAGGSRSRKSRAIDITDEERAAAMRVLGKLGERSGVQYTGAREHLRLIIGRIRDGVPEMHLRFVVAYCAAELGWARKPEMAPYLRPETLFGPKSFAKYLDAAVTWANALPPDDKRQPQQEDAA